jgi:hypothetical protein
MHHQPSFAAAVAVLALAVACEAQAPAVAGDNATAETAAADTSDTAMAAPDVPPFVPKAVYATSIGDWVMKPKQEVTRCVLKRLDNEGDIFVHAIHTKLWKGSHHLIVYRSEATQEKPVPFDCDPFTETLVGDNIPLMISQVKEETLAFPQGVAFKFKAKQMVRLEVHYVNYSKIDDITAHADVEFQTLDPKQLKAEADMLFYGTPDFYIPKGQSFTTPWNFIDVWPNTNIWALTGHTHKLGTNVEIALAQGPQQTVATSQIVYPPKDLPYDWEEPPVASFEPPLTFKSGHGFAYRCMWHNTTDKSVGFGESAEKEMCFFWGYYWPSKGYRMCINPGKFKNRAPELITDPICCPDSALCPLIKQFLANGLP